MRTWCSPEQHFTAELSEHRFALPADDGEQVVCRSVRLLARHKRDKGSFRQYGAVIGAIRQARTDQADIGGIPVAIIEHARLAARAAVLADLLDGDGLDPDT